MLIKHVDRLNRYPQLGYLCVYDTYIFHFRHVLSRYTKVPFLYSIVIGYTQYIYLPKTCRLYLRTLTRVPYVFYQLHDLMS